MRAEAHLTFEQNKKVLSETPLLKEHRAGRYLVDLDVLDQNILNKDLADGFLTVRCQLWPFLKELFENTGKKRQACHVFELLPRGEGNRTRFVAAWMIENWVMFPRRFE